MALTNYPTLDLFIVGMIGAVISAFLVAVYYTIKNRNKDE